MMYYISKQGAVLANGEVLKPRQIVNNHYQDIMGQEFHYQVADSLLDLKQGKYRKIISTKSEFEFLYDNKILRDIKELRPPQKAKFLLGQLVKEKGTRDMGIVAGQKYDYERLTWTYSLYTVDAIRNVHSGNIFLGLYYDRSIDEEDLELTKKGNTSLEIGGDKYNVYYEAERRD